MYEPHTMTQREADNIRKAITAITSSFTWSQTEEGYHFWNKVVESLEKKDSHRTSDGYPFTLYSTKKQ